MIGDAGLHRGSDTQRAMNSNEVVPREVQAVRGPRVH